MSAYKEPPDGDFVAYVEALQRESAARIFAQAHRPLHESPLERMPGAASPVAGGIGAQPVLNRQQAEELMTRLARDGYGAPAVKAALGLMAGLVLLLFWFFNGGGALTFLIGIGLVAWSISRLRGRRRDTEAPGQRERARIARLFGRNTAA
ncbi:MAG TPA: hypothetical protein PLE54_13625 [Burkholderiaceae bacterium]|nr:hypothetical protein [Burkholderiaceae bacterium]HQR71643.1 hypothetical protein [Burkholderiaceae bacterium]